MTKTEMDDLVVLQKKLYDEWEAGCSNGRVFLSAKLVRLIYEFMAYLRGQYETVDRSR